MTPFPAAALLCVFVSFRCCLTNSPPITNGPPIDPDEVRQGRGLADQPVPGGLEDPIMNTHVNSSEGEAAFIIQGDIRLQRAYNPLLRNAVRGEANKWPDGVVPYAIDRAFGPHEREVIAKALDAYHARTCVRFVPRSRGQRNYVYMTKGQGCSSSVGMVGNGRQDVSLDRGCVYVGIVEHELMHALGFMHEQSRADRDNYVQIDFGNIARNNHFNFQKYSASEIDHLGKGYDCNSVMHYNAYAFALDASRPTIRLRGNMAGCRLGQRDSFSQTDVDKINILYRCHGNKPDKTYKPDVDRPDLEECQDGHDRCAEWAGKGECKANKDWMLPNCPLSCGICKKCQDLNKHCPRWAEMGECSANAPYMSEFCRKSCHCGKGKGGKGKGRKTCADADTAERCGYWAKEGRCQDSDPSFAEYMKINCRKSCRFCVP